jgi:hypothetical protein
VNVQINGTIADVIVKQVYVNEDEKKLDASYIFAGSTRAAVYAMKIRIGDRIIEAKVKEKQAARKGFEEARQQGKTASLLEQHRPNVFQMDVANIMPGDRVDVTMHYTETVACCNAIYEFVYPSAVGPRYSKGGEKWVEQAIEQLIDEQPDFDMKVEILSPVPVQTVSCGSHAISVEQPDEKHAIVSLANPLDRQGGNDFILCYGLQGKTVQSGMLTYRPGVECGAGGAFDGRWHLRCQGGKRHYHFRQLVQQHFARGHVGALAVPEYPALYPVSDDHQRGGVPYRAHRRVSRHGIAAHRYANAVGKPDHGYLCGVSIGLSTAQ